MGNQFIRIMIDDYIAQYNGEVRERLEQIRDVIESELPDGYETSLAYGMPTYKIAGKNFFHFAPAAKHIGIYPLPDGVAYFADKYEGFTVSKGTVQFQNDEPLPLDKLRDLVRYRVAHVTGDTFPMK